MAPSSMRRDPDELHAEPPCAEDVDDDASASLERLRLVHARLRTPVATVTVARRTAPPPAPVRAAAGGSVRGWVLLFLVGVGMSAMALLGGAGATQAREVPRGPSVEAKVAEGFARLDVAPEQAVLVFRETLALAPDDARAAAGLGVALAEVGRVDEALPWLCRGVRAPGAVGHAAEDALVRVGRVCP